LSKIVVPLKLMLGIARAKTSMLFDRPACVAGFGGYPALPAMSAAWLLRVPRLLHEQNGVLGRVNQVFAKRVNAVACGTWPTELPKGVTGKPIGNPVRAQIRAVAGCGYAAPSDSGPLELLVFGGSQGASVMRIVPDAVRLLPEEIRGRLVISQQARDADEAEVRAAYTDLGLPVDIRPFFNDMPERLVRAQLVIARSGASTIADLTVIGRPAILIPLASAIRDEQTANARAMVEAGAAVLVPEGELTAEALAAHIARILSDPDHATRAAGAAHALGKPDAAKDLADLVEDLSGAAAK
ncbi:MAG: UDP-N-acetylglucosamine--N-acetylmuramyl-(pentapeptide) pyrophosphoryl-undecaprenol N-acetylglucosamine transferase, partial [Pseudomonadota bacterium]